MCMDLTIKLMDHVAGTSSNVDGVKLFSILTKELDANNTIILSLKDSTPMSSSFLNSSFGELVEKYGLEIFKKQIRLINYTPSQLEYIKKYLLMLNA